MNHVEAFEEVATRLLHTRKSFAPSDFFQDALLSEMQYLVLKKMLENWLSTQIKLGRIYKCSDGCYKTFKNENEKYETDKIKKTKVRINEARRRLHHYEQQRFDKGRQ